MVINAQEDGSVSAQQAMRQLQSREDHVQPISVEPSTGLSVAADLLSTVDLTGQFEIVLDAVLKAVRIDKISTCVVRRVDVDQLDLAAIALLKQFEDFEVVTFNHQVLRAF